MMWWVVFGEVPSVRVAGPFPSQLQAEIGKTIYMIEAAMQYRILPQLTVAVDHA